MIKGPSVGWGANYLLRMAVRDSGILAFGTCHDIVEYAWDGGEVQIDQTSQYATTFNKEIGGISYVDDNKVAEIGGIPDDSIIRNWEGYPILIGFTYKGQIQLTTGRPNEYSHLDSDISEVRFYTDRLSEEEVMNIKNTPKEIGPMEENLAVWLDFDDILTGGTHTTEWRRPSSFIPTYQLEKDRWDIEKITADVKIPGDSEINAKVEISDDGENVKDFKEITLEDGKNDIELSELDSGQYVRIVTQFKSSMVKDSTDIPELYEYEIIASKDQQNTTINWNTIVDWNKGSFKDAAGFEPTRAVTLDAGDEILH